MLIRNKLTDDAIVHTINHVRKDDRAEYEALKGKHWVTIADNLLGAQQSDLHVSSSLWTPQGDLVAVGGFNMSGLSWFLCTDLVEKHPKAFCKEILRNRSMVHSQGAVCHNVVGLNNQLHVRFLKWLGAEISPVVTHKGGWDFARFYIPPPIGDLDV